MRESFAQCYEHNKMKFSEELKQYKANNRFTQGKMASVLGISLRMYQYYERGDYDGSDANIEYYRERLRKGETKDESLSHGKKSEKALCEHIDMSPQSFFYLQSDSAGRSVTVAKIANLVKLHNANANYIFTGMGNKFRSTESGQVAQLPVIKVVKKKVAKKKAAKRVKTKS